MLMCHRWGGWFCVISCILYESLSHSFIRRQGRSRLETWRLAACVLCLLAFFFRGKCAEMACGIYFFHALCLPLGSTSKGICLWEIYMYMRSRIGGDSQSQLCCFKLPSSSFMKFLSPSHLTAPAPFTIQVCHAVSMVDLLQASSARQANSGEECVFFLILSDYNGPCSTASYRWVYKRPINGLRWGVSPALCRSAILNYHVILPSPRRCTLSWSGRRLQSCVLWLWMEYTVINSTFLIPHLDFGFFIQGSIIGGENDEE